MKTTLLTTLSLSLISTAALAHPGHDHSAPESSLIHMGMIAAPMAVAAGIALYYAVRRFR